MRKRVIGFLICAAVSLSLFPFAAAAAEEEGPEVGLDNIMAMTKEQNLNILANYYTSEGMADIFDIAAAYGVSAFSENQASTYLNMEKTDAVLVYTAPTLLLSYYTLENQIMQAGCSLDDARSGAALAEKMYELGMGTYDSVLAAQNGVATLELTIRSLEGSLETLKRQIAVFVGMGADDPFRIKEFQGYAAEELDTVLEGLNKETDLVAARSNSYDLKLQTLTASRGSSNMEKANSYRKDDLRARFNIAFGQMYDDLFIKKAGIEQAASAYALKERDYEIAQKKYELGMLSSMELESAATALEKSGLELTARHLDFAVAVNRYEAMKNGVWFES